MKKNRTLVVEAVDLEELDQPLARLERIIKNLLNNKDNLHPIKSHHNNNNNNLMMNRFVVFVVALMMILTKNL